MEFDDNDFQGQSFQLGGEDNKFPSSLRSFTLPKYDFDENLQVHLGFNGLDDTEDLLGIQNQQHSHWIEDFSRASTRIDFHSSAPESCCISRHINVWSEATSSESVEMLLKSVGQDEVTVKEVALEESVGGDEFKSLNAQMDNNSNEGEGLSLIDTGPALPPDKSVAQFTSSTDDLESQPSVLISEGKGTCSEHIVAVGPSVGTNCASIQNLSSANSLTDANMEDGADCTHHSGLDMASNIDSANVDASEVKMHFLEDNSAVDKVVSSRNEKIIGKEKLIGKTFANSMEGNIFAENSEETLSFEREARSVKTGTSHGPTEVHISEKHELLDVEQRGESGIISSVIVEVQPEDDSTTRNNKTSSVVKVFYPADLIQVPSEMKKVIKNYNDSESGDGETFSRNLSHLHVSDKVAESDTVLNDVITVPKNVVLQEHSIIDQVDRTSHFDETNSGNTLSCKETDETTLTTEVKSDIESKETQSLLPQIDVGVLRVAPEDSSEERTIKKSDPVDNACSTNSQVVDVCLAEKSDVLCSSSKAESFISECIKTIQTPPETVLPLGFLEAETADGNCKTKPQPSGAEDRCNELNNASVGSEGKDALDILPLHFKEKETNDGEETSIVDDIGEKTVDVEVHNSSSNVGLDAQNANELVSQSGQDGERVKSDPVVAENVCEPCASEAANSNFNEETCGSPIAISSQEQVQNDKDSQCCDSIQQEQNASVLDGTHVDIPVTDKPFDNLKLMSDDPVEAEKSFTFEVSLANDVSEKNISQGLNSATADRQPELSQGKECVKESITHHNDEVQEPKVDTALSKNMSDDKVLQASSGGTLKRTRGRVLKETSSRKRKAESIANLSRPSSSSAENASHFDPLSSIQQYVCTEGNNAKSTSATTCLAFNLPDLNSADSPALLHQPFTDLQQVQLRAQIFVYGSLIQGTAPDEACMVSAFGDCSQDGGKSMWERVWKLAVERFYSQKSPVTGLESPLYAQSGGRSAQDKNSTIESGRRSSLFPSAISPAIHLSSPLWSALSQPQDAQCSSAARNFSADTHQSLSPLFPFQFPQMPYRGNTPLWPAQASTAGSPRMAPLQRTFLDTGQGYTALSVAEAVQAIPAQELSTNSTVKPLSTTLTANDGNRTPSLASTKSRKRRKKSVEESVQISPINPLPGLVSVTSNVLSTLPPTSSKVVSGKKPSSSPVISSHFQIVSAGVDAGRKAIFTEQTQSRIEQAKFQAEDAACHASSAARHCQDIWTQLSVKNNSGSVLDTEEKLASAAVAAAAGVSVAKAAAAAAKIALEAVIQAKLIIDEALNYEDDASSQIGHLSSSSNMNAKDKSVHNKSIISATREAAQRRVEDTSAAAKRAENLDAIVKAAELALEAVGQTGTIIAMGDPVPLKLKELLESGMHGYWKRHSIPSECKMAPNKVCRNDEHLDANDAVDVVCGGSQHLLGETPRIEVENATNINSSSDNIQHSQKQPDAGKAMGNRIESGAGPESSFSMTAFDSSKYNITDGSKGSFIVEGSHVEVVRQVGESRGIWHLAKVLIVKDEEAFVCYDELRNEGSDQFKEWVPLRGIGDEPPRIRNAQGDGAALKYEGTRKRRRAAIGNNSWCIGDHVDVHMHSCWRTAMVTEKDKEDGTKLTVQFLDDKVVSVVQTWDLRPSLVWNNGRWVEWSRQSNYRNSEGDGPLEKRQKLGRQETGAQSLAAEKKSMSKEPVVENLTKFEGSWAHMLTEKDKIFTIGKETEKQPNAGTLKMKRTGLQKEGSKVVFGIPKPGKRRKFMDVSKHYVAEKRPDKSNEITDSTKLVKYLMPQGASRNWKNAPKAEFRGKQVSNNISRVPKSGKLHSKQSKPSPETEIPSISVRQVPLHNAKRSASLEETADENQPSLAVVSLSDDCRTSAAVDLSSDALSSQKVSNVGANKVGKEKLGATGKAPGGQEKRSRLNYPPSSKVNLTEPRRSNRRIQPTSRLLEGLQSSSLTVAKMPPMSLDKGVRSFSRS